MQIINHSEGTINSFVYVHQFKLQKIKINSELFEIKIMLPKESKGRKTVDVRMSLNEVKRDEN